MTTEEYDTEALRAIPKIISLEDHEKLLHLNALEPVSSILFYEELMDRYPRESHPFFLVRKASLLVSLGGGAVAVNLYMLAQDILSDLGIIDQRLDSTLEQLSAQVSDEANETLKKSKESFRYYQHWRPTKQHVFPTYLPQLPFGAQDLKACWQALTQEGSLFFEAYLTKVAIETNHVEGIFLLEDKSTHDLIRRGISEGEVTCLPQSAISDPGQIRSTLHDTLAAYQMLTPMLSNSTVLDKPIVCSIHETLMKSCRFTDNQYIAAGSTRTLTKKTVAMSSGTYSIQTCPFPEVDAELEYICRMAKQWIKNWRNPFASACWTHQILVSCYPFDDGNGRLARIIASIPLMQHGFPPFSVTFNQRSDYYSGIRQGHEGDYSALVECIVYGMRETLEVIRSSL